MIKLSELMDIDEAIQHCLDKYFELKKENCPCSYEHLQLANWLINLKLLELKEKENEDNKTNKVKKTGRLVRKAKPRRKYKEVILTTKFNFRAYNDNYDLAKLDCTKFKQWMGEIFSKWDDSILQNFLYSYKLTNDENGDNYELSCHIDKIIKDESSKADEIEKFVDDIKHEDDSNLNIEDNGEQDEETD
jgi:hypothetical protein